MNNSIKTNQSRKITFQVSYLRVYTVRIIHSNSLFIANYKIITNKAELKRIHKQTKTKTK
jgi:hypothetical protein